MKLWKRFSSLAMAGALAVSLTACGGQESASQPQAANGQSGSGAEVEPIYIGELAVLTGDQKLLGTTCHVSMELAKEEINTAGGINGRPIEFVTMDTSGDPTECVELAKQLIEDERICAILGPVRGAVEGYSACPITNEAGIVTLLPICSVSDFCAEMGDYVFSMAGKQSYEMPHLANAVLKDILDVGNVAILYKNNEWGVSSVEALTASCDELGIEIAGLEPYAETETDFTTVLTKLRQTNPDAIVLVSEAVDGANVLTQMQRLGWTDVTKVGVGSMYSDQTFEYAAEGSVEGLITTAAYFVSEEDPRGYAYAQAFEERAGYPPTVHGPLSYDSVLMLAEAIKNVGTDRTAIMEELYKLQDVDGIAGPYTFTEDGDILRDYMVIHVVDGEFVKY